MSIGKNIKEFRNKLGITQEELADKLYVTYQAVSRWENDETEPSISTITQICEIFNCSVDELLGISEKERENLREEEKNRKIFDEKRKAKGEEIEEFIIEIQERIKERLEEVKQKEIKAKQRRTIGLVVGTLIAAVIIANGILIALSFSKVAGIGVAVSSILFFTFINCLAYDNNFVSFSFKYIIKKCSFLLFFFEKKDLFFEFIFITIGFILSLCVLLFVLIIFAIFSVLSVFLFPVALYRNLNIRG